VQVSTARKKLRPGALAPITGVYAVTHGVRHRDRHEVVIIRGEQLPTCRTCKLNVIYEIVRPISHVTHDWDFSGPFNLAVQPQHEDPEGFRMYRRAQIQLPIQLRLDGSSPGGSSSPGKVIQGYMTDLSAGGLGAVIRTDVPSRFKTEAVRIQIERGRDSLSLAAHFRYQNGLRHGFEFINLSAGEREGIRRVITKHKTRAAGKVG
jgi:hypothetical protein